MVHETHETRTFTKLATQVSDAHRLPFKLEDSKPPIMETKTPAPIQTPAILPPFTLCRDRIKSFREGVEDTNIDSTTSTSAKEAMARVHSETAARLEQSLKETMEDRKKALTTI